MDIDRSVCGFDMVIILLYRNELFCEVCYTTAPFNVSLPIERWGVPEK
jgi:hypothetical protein